MIARRIALAILGPLVLVAGCTSVAGSLPTAPQLIVAAEQQVQSGAFDQAIDTLTPISDMMCPKRLSDRRDLAIGQAELGRGQPWRAYLALEDFSALHPHSELRSQVVDVIWSAGKSLIDSDGGFLFFWSDKRAGRAVLEHLITRHPDTRRLADALRILGDMAFEDGDFELAQDRYRDIILNRPESEWRFHAQFRFAMSIVASLRGPDYDLNRMEHAVRELHGFLANKPEDPLMLEATNKALQQVKQWQVQRHISIADFYNTLKSTAGQRYHLQLATHEKFIKTPAYQLALQLREQFEAANPLPDTGSSTTASGGQR